MPPPELLQGDAVNMVYKRPGTLGVDYDPYGEEMAPNARIWKSYVEQTDRMDKEMVDGWNKTLDIILLFAALFSAISTAFVLESSKDLKPDPAITSAQTLSLISQTLLAMSNGSSISLSTPTSTVNNEFTPETSAIVVNTLWFMSLSLSVSVTLISILAKEWCDGFMSGRIGSMLKQGRMRQQRWDGIERWKMREILYMLPLLMHAALLLFAIGLSLYLWNINSQVALPVVATSALTVLFYLVTVISPLFSQFSPYATTLTRLVFECLIALFKIPATKKLVGIIWGLKLWLLQRLARLGHLFQVLAQTKYIGKRAAGLEDGQITDSKPRSYCYSLLVCRSLCPDLVDTWMKQLQARSSTDRSQLMERETLMDSVTSSMIVWMITHCEDPRSVDLVSQALSGADVQVLPREPLWECGLIDLVRQRLEFCLEALYTMGMGSEQDILVENASLYSRSLNFLTSYTPTENFFIGGQPVSHNGYSATVGFDWNRETHPEVATGFGFVLRPFSILKHSMDSFPIRYDIAAFELNNYPLELDDQTWNMFNHHRNQHYAQWKHLKQIIAGRIKLSSSSALALVNGITKAYLYKLPELPYDSLVPLVDLLNTTTSLDVAWGALWQERENLNKLRRAIGVALAVIRTTLISDSDPPRPVEPGNSPETNPTQARVTYRELLKIKLEFWDVEMLLMVGLLWLMDRPRIGGGTNHTLTEIKSIGKALHALEIPSYMRVVATPLPLPDPIPHVHLDIGAYWASITSDWINSAVPQSECVTEFNVLAMECINTFLCPKLCRGFSESIIPVLVECFDRNWPVEPRKRCLEALKYALPAGDDYQRDSNSRPLSVFKDQLLETNFLDQLRLFMDSEITDKRILLDGLYFLWVAVRCVDIFREEMRLPKLLHTIFKCTAELGSDGIPRNQSGMSLIDIWRTDLEQMCTINPELVLDSKLLDELILFYKHDHSEDEPWQAQLPERGHTWLTILRGLKTSCENRVATQTRVESSGVIAEELGQDETEQQNKFSSNA